MQGLMESRETVAQCGEGWCPQISQSLQRGDDPILLQRWSSLWRTGSKVDAAWSSVAHSRLCASISKMLETMYIGMAFADFRKNSSAYIWFVHTHIIIMWKWISLRWRRRLWVHFEFTFFKFLRCVSFCTKVQKACFYIYIFFGFMLRGGGEGC